MHTVFAASIHRSQGLSVALVVAFFVAASGCMEAPPQPEVRGLGLSRIEPTPDEALSTTPRLRLHFDAAVGEASVEVHSVVLVPFPVSGPCSVDLDCSSGRCSFGRCQRDPVDTAFLSDLRRPPLSASRAARVVALRVELEPGGRSLVVQPEAVLDAHRRYALLVAPTLRGEGEHDAPLGDDPLRFDLHTSDEGRPTLEMLSPRAATTGLPTNLERLLVKASEPLAGATGPGLFWLEGGSGERAALRAEEATDLCPGAPGMPRCLRLVLGQSLPPLTIWRLVASPRVTNARGEPLFIPPSALRLASGPGPDPRAPTIVASRATVSDGCLNLSLRCDEPCDLRWRGSWGQAHPSGLASERHDLALVLDDPSAGRVWLRVSDLAGNSPAEDSMRVVAPASAPVSIVEVFANPAGSEAALEFVEVVNHGARAVDLAGFTLDDDDDGVGADTLPQVVLEAGQRAVITGPRFDPTSAAMPVAQGALHVPLETAIGALGLANGAGERLVLRDAEGKLVSTYGGHLAMDKKSYEGLSVAREVGRCDIPASWRRGAPTPGGAPGEAP